MRGGAARSDGQRGLRVQTRLRSLLACLAIGLVAIGTAACGEADKGSGLAQRPSSAPATGVARAGTSSPSSSAGSSALDTDGDNDRPGNNRYDTDNDSVSTYGHTAAAADIQAITALFRRYYALAAAGDGARACSMVYWLFAETVVEEHDRGKGPSSLRGNTCAQVASKLFKQRHREAVEDVATLQVARVRLNGNQGMALVRFGATRERDVLVHRDRGAWKMSVLLDNGAP